MTQMTPMCTGKGFFGNSFTIHIRGRYFVDVCMFQTSSPGETAERQLVVNKDRLLIFIFINITYKLGSGDNRSIYYISSNDAPAPSGTKGSDILLLTKNPARSFSSPWCQIYGISFERFPRPLTDSWPTGHFNCAGNLFGMWVTNNRRTRRYSRLRLRLMRLVYGCMTIYHS